jgi:prepilin-type N-terminal cleavage/methylation domain-containing protein
MSARQRCGRQVDIRGHERGFTLVELLVGLLLAAMILTGLTAATHTISRGWHSGTNAALRHDMFDRGLDVIAGDLARIERIIAPGAGPDSYLFGGSETEMTYMLVDRPYPTTARPYFIRLIARKGGWREQLVRERAAHAGGAFDLGQAVWGDQAVLLEGDYAFRFAYRTAHEGQVLWSDAWAWPSKLPEQVRLEVLDGRTGRLAIPPVVFALRIQAEAVCVNPAAEGCTVKSGGELLLKPR